MQRWRIQSAPRHAAPMHSPYPRLGNIHLHFLENWFRVREHGSDRRKNKCARARKNTGESHRIFMEWNAREALRCETIVEKKVENCAYSMLRLDSHSRDLRRGVPFVGTSLSYPGSCPWAEFKAYERVYIRNYTTITDTCMNWIEISMKFAVSFAIFIF